MTEWITVSIAQTRGSVPREVGALMRVARDRVEGTIGGGALEWDAMQLAREMLAQGRAEMTRSWSLGPELGQCCGGAVTLEFRAGAEISARAAAPLWIWGAGHVGRAVVRIMAPFEDREIFLVDVAQDRFPVELPPGVAPVIATDPVRLVTRAAQEAEHLIVTYSHDLDLRLCDALLRHGFASVGLIGSTTKWARFRKRLGAMGHADAQISCIRCPIGRKDFGKHPQAIAVGVAATLLTGVERQVSDEDLALGEGIAL